MANQPLVLSAPLCFLRSKYGRIQLTTMKNVLKDFYNAEDLATAKFKFLLDLEKLNSHDKLPVTAKRRDSANRLTLKVDDLLALFTYIDEHKLFDMLPIYVTDDVDAVPSLRITEGDFRVLLTRLDKFDDRLNDMQAYSTNMAADILAIRRSVVDITSKQITNASARVLGNSASASTSTMLSKAPIAMGNVVLDTDTTTQHVAKSSSQSWAEIVSSITPIHSSSTTHAVASSQLLSTQVDQPSGFGSAGFSINTGNDIFHDNHGDSHVDQDNDFHVVESRSAHRRRLKRQRQHTNEEVRLHSNLPNQPITEAMQQPSNQMQHSTNKPLIVGKCASLNECNNLSSGIPNKPRLFGVRPLINRPHKVVFCIDNVHHSITKDDMLSFLHGLSVDVISLFEVKSRRRRNDMNYHLRKAFRLCIDESQVDRLLNENSWPVDIVISYWFFKGEGEGQSGNTVRSSEVINSTHLLPPGQVVPSESAMQFSSDRSADGLAPVTGHHQNDHSEFSEFTAVLPTDVIKTALSSAGDTDDVASSLMDAQVVGTNADADEPDDTILMNSTVIEQVVASTNSTNNG